MKAALNPSCANSILEESPEVWVPAANQQKLLKWLISLIKSFRRNQLIYYKNICLYIQYIHKAEIHINSLFFFWATFNSDNVFFQLLKNIIQCIKVCHFEYMIIVWISSNCIQLLFCIEIIKSLANLETKNIVSLKMKWCYKVYLR